MTGHQVKPVLADQGEITQAITRVYLTRRPSAVSVPAPTKERPKAPDRSDPKVTEFDSPIIKLVSKILVQAIRLGTSDVHLEPGEEQVFLRYRIDGILHDYPPPDIHSYPAVVSRIKILASLDIAERRLPQDGRISIDLEGKLYDLRVSLLPNIYGEGVCIRILDPTGANRELTEMGFSEELLARYDRVIRRPHGIVLVTGPTGSGKSTTLYGTLNRIRSRERKLITIEDPVEYKLDGLVQIPINPDIGFTFEAGLRAILRHDPDIIMLGEIRDLPSAQMAFRAALTGHLLFSTLHTNSASLAVTRLVDMGLEAYQALPALNGILAQRLMRLLCAQCKVPRVLDHDQIQYYGLDDSYEGHTIYEPLGCSNCQGIGYKGRTAVHEFIEITSAIRKIEPDRLTPTFIEELAREDGFRSLREVALERFLAGDTSASEMLMIAAAD